MKSSRGSGGRGSFPIRATFPSKNHNIVNGKNGAKIRISEMHGGIIGHILSIILALVIFFSPLLIWMIPRSHVLVSNRDYDVVEKILINDELIVSKNYDNQEFFRLLKWSWTRVPIFWSCNCGKVEHNEYYISIVYTDGTDDDIYVLSSAGGHVIRQLQPGHNVPTAKSYLGYDKIVEYIKDNIQ